MRCKCLLLCIGIGLSWTVAAQSAEPPGPQRQHELIRLVRQDCGACHGMTLKGGLGSPLLPDSLREKPPAGLVATVLYGRPGTPMPPWKSILDENEVEWIVAQLLKGFPQE